MLRQIIAFAVLPLIASCVGPRETAAPMPAPTPAAAPRPAPTPPAPVVDRYAGDWSVVDLGPGDWRYSRNDSASAARFGLANEGATAMLRCEGGQLVIARDGVIAADRATFLNIRTSFAERQLPARSLPSTGHMLAATLPPGDPLWDQIIYSRGRFVIEASANVPMIVPTRAELARVVEDCRG